MYWEKGGHSRVLAMLHLGQIVLQVLMSSMSYRFRALFTSSPQGESPKKRLHGRLHAWQTMISLKSFNLFDALFCFQLFASKTAELLAFHQIEVNSVYPKEG